MTGLTYGIIFITFAKSYVLADPVLSDFYVITYYEM